MHKNKLPHDTLLKGMMPRERDWLKWILMEDQKNLGFQSIFLTLCDVIFMIQFKKTHLVVSYLTVTLRIMSNNHRSVSSIG